jgi:outer membrane autotransporter protein
VTDNSSLYDFIAVLNGTNIDLQIVLAIDASNTLMSLATARDAQTETMAQRFARLYDSQSRDCQVFGDQGLCASLTGEYARASDDSQSAGGALTVAYRFGPRVRLGGFVDYTPSLDTPAGISLGTATAPLFGAFMGYDASGTNGIGLQTKIVGAYQSGDVTITRDASASGVEPGSGRSKIAGGSVGAEMAFGMPLTDALVFSPYAGVAYTTVQRDAYSETATTDVSSPIGYDRYFLDSTTASAGVRVAGMASRTFAYTAGVGVEYDVARRASDFTGTSGISGLSSFSLANGWSDTLLRLTGSLGFAYSYRPHQALAGSVTYKGDTSFKGDSNLLVRLGLRNSF